MVLRSRFSRGFLLIMLAGSVGMFAQEMVSRLSLAGDHPLALASVSGWSWQSAEAFYQGHPGVFWEQIAQSEPDFSVAPASVVPDAPHNEGVASTNGVDPSPAADYAAVDAYQFAAVEEPEPIVELRPASMPNVEPKEPAELPAPEVRVPEIPAAELAAPELPASEVDRPEPEVLLPPSPQRRVRGPVELVESASDPAGMPVAAPSAHSDRRYADPAELVRQRGIERGQQLQRRLEAQRMMGYHSLRPPVQASPFTSGDQIRPVVIIVPRTVVVQQR
jgi:hypothetical protein